MLTRRESDSLDRHITGNYGEDQFQDYLAEDYPHTTAHELAFLFSWADGVYEYDPADDGPECEIITRILATGEYRGGTAND